MLQVENRVTSIDSDLFDAYKRNDKLPEIIQQPLFLMYKPVQSEWKQFQKF
jgi:hypothetical protein